MAAGLEPKEAIKSKVFPTVKSTVGSTVDVINPATGKAHTIPKSLILQLGQNFDPNTFPYENFMLSGRGAGVKKLPGTDELGFVSQAGARPVTGPKPRKEGKLITDMDQATDRQEEDFKKARERIEKNDFIKNSVARHDDIQNIKNLLVLDIGTATGPLQSLAARSIANEKGALSEGDVQRNTGSQDLANKFGQIMKKIKSGGLTEKNRRELALIINQVEIATQIKQAAFVQGFIKEKTPELKEFDPNFLSQSLTPITLQGFVPKQLASANSKDVDLAVDLLSRKGKDINADNVYKIITKLSEIRKRKSGNKPK